MKPHTLFSPVSLRYIAALRGNKPKKTGTAFTYAEAMCQSPENLTCLAASNPEGRFYGFVADDKIRRVAEEQAAMRGTFNIIFLTGKPSEILARLGNGSALPPMLDYLCCDEGATALDDAERAALFELADKRLNPGGLFARSYRAYDREDGALRFIVRELAPEMTEGQKKEFLHEIKYLGRSYLSRHADVAAKLDAAIAKGAPQEFFALFDGGAATSGAFDMLVAMATRGMLYAGDANVGSNYVELAIPVDAQDLIVKCRNSPIYEPIKDFALDRTMRNDIWVKAPAQQSADPGELFGGFAYGIVMPRDQIPLAYAAQGKVIDLSGPLYAKLIDLMSIMPVGVGDILSYPATAQASPQKIIETLQIIVACGFAIPMRGAQAATKNGNISQPRLVGTFNRFLDKTDLSDREVLFASQVVGCGVALPASDAFVMQALNRAGLNNSVSALMPELRRISNTPASLSILKTDEPTVELAHELIVKAVEHSLLQWYAYALLEAA